MKTLIIPCAGRSMINGKPKWLLKHPDGKYLIRKCVCGIDLSIFYRIIITILNEDERKYNASEIIGSEYSDLNNVEILILDKPTNGPAETIYRTIIEKDIVGKIAIKDSDVFVKVDNDKYDNFVAGLNLLDYDDELPNIRNKSFIIANEQNQILDIIEKQIKSDLVCLGYYGIRDANDFKYAYKALSDIDYSINCLYVSHIVAYLIGFHGLIFNYVKITDFENWETEKDWLSLNKKLGTYFIEFDKFITINGKLNKHVKDSGKISSEGMEMISKLIMKGAQIVLFTSLNISDESLVLEIISKYKIEPLSIIYGCNYSSKKILSSLSDLKNEILEI